jgi:hypothetical protein
MTFTHRFSRSLSCSMTVTDQPPVGGERYLQKIEWSGRPKPKHAREYIRWCHVVHSHLADHWGLRLMHAVQISPTLWEFWAYAPGQAPKLVSKLSSTR